MSGISSGPSNTDFLLRIGFAQSPGYSRVTALGNCPTITAAASIALPQDVWTAGGAYPWMTAGTALEVVSSSVNDAAAGTGARTISLTALDANYNPITTAAITLNGTTPVQIPGGAVFFRINLAVVLTSGTLKTNAGTITIRDTGAGATRGIIPIGYGIIRQSIYTVPAGSTLQIISQIFSIVNPSAAKDCTVASYIQSSTGVYRMPLELSPSAEPYRQDGIPGLTLSEKTDFAHRVTAASGVLTLNSGILAVQKLNTAI